MAFLFANIDEGKDRAVDHIIDGAIRADTQNESLIRIVEHDFTLDRHELAEHRLNVIAQAGVF